MTGPVTIRDRRTLPFFQVRLHAIEEIRNTIGGTRRARALGLYALLCQVANEQRATGEHLRLTATYHDLTRRGGLSPNSLKVILRGLEAAGAARHEVRVDRLRGSLPSIIHLPVQDGPWIGITVAMAEHLAAQTVIHPLSALGLLIVLLEFCDEQREVHGGLVAETTRADIARRLGCSSDSLDTWVKALESAHVLAVTRRRGLGGVHLPNIWELRELVDDRPECLPPVRTQSGVAVAEDENRRGRQRETPPPRHDRALAENGKHPPGDQEAAAPAVNSALAAEEKCPDGNSATPASAGRPINAHERDQAELSTTEENPPPNPSVDLAPEEGETSVDRDPVGLCRALLAVLEVTRGGGPVRRYGEEPDRWHEAARRILVDHPGDKVLQAIAYLEFDQVIGTKVRSMPDLERHIEDLRHRAHVARRQTGTSAQLGGPTAPTWADAMAQISEAIRRHGAGGSVAARNELAAVHQAYGAFIDLVGWTSLCREDPQRRQWDWQQAWKQTCLAPTVTDSTQEAAA